MNDMTSLKAVAHANGHAARARETLLMGQRDDYLRACRDLWRAAHPVTLPEPMPEREAVQ